MKCPFCGTYADDNAKYCPNCQVDLQDAEVPKTPGSGTEAPAPELGMGWYKFLIWFALFAGALLNLVRGIQMMSGDQYDGYADQVYRVFDGLKGLDMVAGVALITLAVIAIVARFSLAAYKKNGPKLLILLYAFNAGIQIIYTLAAKSIISAATASVSLDTSSAFSSAAFALAMAAINYSYFKKREHLFVN